MAEPDTPGSGPIHTLTIRLAKKAPKPDCFLGLPAELRNAIYEMVYDDCAPKDETIPLRQPKAPSNALLLACRRTYIEAQDYYLEANKRYWEEGKFEFRYNFDTHRLRKQDFDRLGRNVELINHLHISVDAGHNCRVTWDLADRRGIWRFKRVCRLYSPLPPVLEYIALHSRDQVGSKITPYLHMHVCPTLKEAVAFCEANGVKHTLYAQLYSVFCRQFNI